MARPSSWRRKSWTASKDTGGRPTPNRFSTRRPIRRAGGSCSWGARPVCSRPPTQMADPRPGKANVRTRFGVVPAAGGKTTWIHVDPARYEYVSRVDWAENAPPTLLLLTRDQKDLSLVAADPRTGAKHELLREHDDDWLNVNPPRGGQGPGRDYRWLPDGSGFLWSTEARGSWQLQLRDKGGQLLRELTPPGFGYAGLQGLDAKAGTAFVGRAAEPIETQIYEVPLEGGEPRPLTQGPAQHAGVFARGSRGRAIVETPRTGQPIWRVYPAPGSA